ncbi:butyrophilin subfamily 3 member A3-like isoform X2 [Alosa pseudoharengus]|uniref:butyrophilin subfamily 3 member A3-like isoform X2 n=1 Tax=Alosa pseudoharengus TaxID=34774 RepID=UPI003F88D35B
MWWLLLFLPVCRGAQSPDTFTLSVPDGPLSVWMGSSVILPCSLSPAFTASLKVRWHRPDKYKTPVLLYEKQQIQQQPADSQYRGRVSLMGELEKGNVSLKLENVSLADTGEFVCFVAGDKWYEKASVHLIVKVMGSPPVLSVTVGGSGQVNVTCVSDGWSPKPTLTWRNNRGALIPSQSHHSATDARGLVSVTSWLLHSSSDSEWVACSVGLSEEERKESRVLPHTSKTGTVELERILRDRDAEMENLKQKSKGLWKEVFISGLVLLLLSSIATGLILYKKGFIKWKDSKETAAESQQDKLRASGGETESLLKKQSEEVETLKKEVETLKEKNTDLLKKQSEEVETVKKEVETLNQKITGLQSQLDTSDKEVERLNRQIKDEGKNLEGKVNDIEKENQELKQQNKGLQSQLDTSKREVERLNHEIKGLQSQLDTSNREVERLNRQIKDEGKNLEGKVNDIEKENQELKQQNKGAFPHNHGLVMLWKTVKHFKRDLTMDEASVKGNLEVHTRGKNVKCTKVNKDETQNNMSAYVLCKETFHSGQHFWEVKAEKKKFWFVGVCSDTLREQHGVSLTPQNGCWLLCYDDEQKVLYVNTDQKITSVQEKMKYRVDQLGVFLDCCRHSLTFYNCDDKSWLCTICDVGPTLPLVPVFSPGERDLYDLQIMN